MQCFIFEVQVQGQKVVLIILIVIYICLSSMKWNWNKSECHPSTQKLLDYQKLTIFYVWYWYNTSSWPPPSLAMVPHSWLPLLLPVILCYSKCPLFWQKLSKMRHKIHKINIEYCNTLLHSTIVTHQTQLLHFFLSFSYLQFHGKII